MNSKMGQVVQDLGCVVIIIHLLLLSLLLLLLLSSLLLSYKRKINLERIFFVK